VGKLKSGKKDIKNSKYTVNWACDAMQPVKMCWNAFSTFDESSADVSIKDKLFFSTTITDATITLGAGTTATGNTLAAARVQNSAARLINDVPYHEQITPCLWELHWPPVQLTTECKLCLMTLNVHNARYPPLYLSHMMQSAETLSRPFYLHPDDSASYLDTDKIWRTGLLVLSSRTRNQLPAIPANMSPL